LSHFFMPSSPSDSRFIVWDPMRVS
jgi:hypothetical protein